MTQSALFPASRPFVSPETFDAFFAVVDRLDVVLAWETRALSRHDHRDLAEAARQKRQGLLELDRITRALKGTIPSTEIAERLSRFREALAVNQSALDVELGAAQAVTRIITHALRDLESDGTYSRSYGRAAAYDAL